MIKKAFKMIDTALEEERYVNAEIAYKDLAYDVEGIYDIELNESTITIYNENDPLKFTPDNCSCEESEIIFQVGSGTITVTIW